MAVKEPCNPQLASHGEPEVSNVGTVLLDRSAVTAAALNCDTGNNRAGTFAWRELECAHTPMQEAFVRKKIIKLWLAPA